MSQLVLGVLAVMIGLAVGAAVFVPFIAIAYRRRGGLTGRELMVAAAAVLYFVAIWVYTLLPLPERDAVVCTEAPQLNPLAFVDDIEGALQRGHILSDAAFLQLALNVLLFVPLGFLIRVGLRRGIVASVIAGIGLSLLIETTQVTGVWGLYPCAYRLFDVDDLLTNTLGAVVGSLLALMVPPKWRVPARQIDEALKPRPVTRARRLLAGFCDLVLVSVVSFAALVAILVAAAVLVGDHVLDPNAAWLRVTISLVPFAITAVFMLSTGQSIGQAAVQLRYTGSPLPMAIARLVLFLAGIGGYQILNALPPGVSRWLAAPFVIVSIVMIFTTRAGRGLPGLASRSDLVDARSAAPASDERVGR